MLGSVWPSLRQLGSIRFNAVGQWKTQIPVVCCPTRGMASQPNTGVIIEAQGAREQKQMLRNSIKARLRDMRKEEMEAESAAIAQHVLSGPLLADGALPSGRLGIYLHCERLREVNTTAILEGAMAAGKMCYVPVVEDKQSNMKLLHLDDMASLHAVPPFGIMEPSRTYSNGEPRADVLQEGSDGCLDVLIVPGLGFDTRGGRLGRGGGYYDKAISRLMKRASDLARPPPLIVGLAFSAQMATDIPLSDHDRKLDMLVTAQEVYDFRTVGVAQ